MRIDERVEGHVREAFSAVIARNSERLNAAMQVLDPADSAQAVDLALIVCSAVTQQVCPEGTDEAYRELGRQIVELEEDWAPLNVETVTTFLKSVARDDPSFGGLNREDVVGLAFICGGHLLAAFHVDGQRWWEYLEQIWADLEATP